MMPQNYLPNEVKIKKMYNRILRKTYVCLFPNLYAVFLLVLKDFHDLHLSNRLVYLKSLALEKAMEVCRK